MIYNPHFEKGMQIYQNITNAHAGELAILDFYYEQWKDESGTVVQLLPRFYAEYKGRV